MSRLRVGGLPVGIYCEPVDSLHKGPVMWDFHARASYWKQTNKQTKSVDLMVNLDTTRLMWVIQMIMMKIMQILLVWKSVLIIMECLCIWLMPCCFGEMRCVGVVIYAIYACGASINVPTVHVNKLRFISSCNTYHIKMTETAQTELIGAWHIEWRYLNIEHPPPAYSH